VVATVSDRILATLESRLLAFTPTVVSRSAWRPSSPTDGSGVLADVVGIYTWRTGTAALWITSVEDTAASTYDLHATHSKINIIM
jgi:hypothetical protein